MRRYVFDDGDDKNTSKMLHDHVFVLMADIPRDKWDLLSKVLQTTFFSTTHNADRVFSSTSPLFDKNRQTYDKYREIRLATR